MRYVYLALLALAGTGVLSAQPAFTFTEIGASSARPEAKTILLDVGRLQTELQRAPQEFSRAKSNTRVTLPLPDGGTAEYTVWDVDLLPNHRDIGSYRLENEYGSGRMAISPRGAAGLLQGPEGYFVISAIDAAAGLYQILNYGAYAEELAAEMGGLACGYTGEDLLGADAGADHLEESKGVTDRGRAKAGNLPRELRQYDLIMTCTGEFAVAQGGTEAAVLDAFNIAVTTINAILEPQVGVRINLIEVPGLIYLDPDTDPFTDAGNGTGLLAQVITAFEANEIPAASYDLGHILTRSCQNGLGGVVSGNACTAGKTRGVTCVFGNNVQGAAMRIMAHEVAHQFAVSHSWNSCPPNANQRASETAFEPGSGTTLMSYAGACDDQNIGAEDPYYHVASLEQFLQFTRETGARECATVIETDNFTPEVTLDYIDGFTIPAGTPFKLEGTATDANDDQLFYNWEQYDLGPAVDIEEPRGNAPIFRSVEPRTDGNVRYFPRLDRVVNGTQHRSERLPTYTRDLTFRLTAHDYHPEAGGVDWETVAFRADTAAGPFLVNNPDTNTWYVGDYTEVTWDVAGTDRTPVGCERVNIYLSTNNGLTFDVELARNVPNTGSAFITVPPEAISFDARLLVEAADNVFFNVNRREFSVREPVNAGYTLVPELNFQELCLPTTFTTGLRSSSILGFTDTVALSVVEDSLPAGATVSFSSDRIVPGQAVDLRLELTDVNFTGLINLTVLAVTPSRDTARRPILLDVVNTDFSDLEAIAPEEGTGGIVLGTDFEWTDAANANTYDIEIATSPTFAEATIFERATRLGESRYQPLEFFAPNTLYYWRVRPDNRCGAGAWLTTNSFRTVNSACETYRYDGDAVNIPGRGPAVTIESSIFVEQSGAINDLNLPDVRIQYQFVSALRVELVSPAETVVVLYDKDCRLSNTLFRIGFDDDAPDPASCPVDDQRVVLPKGSLADFNGEDTFGNWTLRVTALETGGTVGALEAWSIEFCADVSAVPPARLANASTEVPPLATNSVSRENLEVTSDAYGSADVIYTLTEVPAAGTLNLGGMPLMVGDTFSQADINAFRLKYTHTDAAQDLDLFRFLVTTPDGGYLPIESHAIIVTEDAVIVSTGEAADPVAGLVVFPNPTSGEVRLRWAASGAGALPVDVYDLNGRRLRAIVADAAAGAATVRLDGLPSGVYLLRLAGRVHRVLKQ